MLRGRVFEMEEEEVEIESQHLSALINIYLN
jgi:hypothetical protein